ncbi:MAG: VOC family protein [Ectothiorhodospiraceae bacterium]|nr:VOC family protein [Ectothiorhodospiraceae bacterium]
MSRLFKKIDTVFVTVEDMGPSVAWYQECLGLDILWEDAFITVMGGAGETPLTLVRRDSPNRHHPLFNFLTDDIHAARRHLESHGVTVGELIETEVLSTFDFLDRDGNRLNVCCPKER